MSTSCFFSLFYSRSSFIKLVPSSLDGDEQCSYYVCSKRIYFVLYPFITALTMFSLMSIDKKGLVIFSICGTRIAVESEVMCCENVTPISVSLQQSLEVQLK